jgi:hypothetical protein
VVLGFAVLLVSPAAGEDSLGRVVPSDSVLSLRLRLDRTGPYAACARAVVDAARKADLIGEFTAHIQGLRREEAALLEARARDEKDGPAKESLARAVRYLQKSIRATDLDVARWSQVLGRVNWLELLAQELVVAARVEGERLEWLLASRLEAGDVPARLHELKGVLYGFGAVIPDLAYSSSASEDLDVTLVVNEADPGEEICLAGTQDLILVTTSSRLMRRVLSLLKERGTDVGLVHLPEYRAALSSLSAESPLFPGGRTSLGDFQLLIRPGAPAGGGLSLAADLESFVAAGEVGPAGISWVFRAAFREPGGAGSAPAAAGAGALRKMLLEQPALGDFARLVPGDSSAFAATGGSSASAQLALVEGFLRSSIPGGQPLIERLEAEPWYRRARDGLLPYVSGRRFVSAAAGRFAVLWELSSPEAARNAWDDLSTALERAGIGGALESGAALPGGASLRSAVSAERGGAPVFGVAGDAFAVASDIDALAAMLRVRRGEAPALGDRPELVERLELPSAELQSVYQGDVGELFGWLGRGLALLPGLAKGYLGESDEAALRPLLGSVARLGEAAGGLDFLGTVTGYGVREGSAYRGAGRITLEGTGK